MFARTPMRLRFVWLAIIVGFLASSNALPTESNSYNAQLKTPPTYSTTTKTDRRMLKSYVTETDEDNGNTEEDNSEERLDNASVAQLAKLEAIKITAMFKHWFQGGKTIEQVRTLFSLPAKGEAVAHANWPKFLKYLEFVEEQQAYAAALAKVEAVKMKLTYRNWYVEKKTFEEVRKILGLPSEGTAVGHPNWTKFEDYLESYKQLSKEFS